MDCERRQRSVRSEAGACCCKLWLCVISADRGESVCVRKTAVQGREGGVGGGCRIIEGWNERQILNKKKSEKGSQVRANEAEVKEGNGSAHVTGLILS